MKVNIFWFRRDLRLNDNHGLLRALESGEAVLPLFIFDTQILNSLAPDDRRVSFIYEQIFLLKQQLQEQGSDLLVLVGDPLAVFEEVTTRYQVGQLFFNHDYEPYAISRDLQIERSLHKKKVAVFSFKDHVAVEKAELLTGNNQPYSVFTPYYKKWRELVMADPLAAFASEADLGALYRMPKLFDLPSLSSMGFERQSGEWPQLDLSAENLGGYDASKDNINGTSGSRAGMYLRFGVISSREALQAGKSWSEPFLRELAWREFFMQILYHYPEVTSQSFRTKYENVPWRKPGKDFEAWKQGQTGYPLVDAGMRQLNQTGYLPNRVRMVVAGFLCKHLLVHWKQGEAYFAQKLLDYELASNNGNWQWAAGTGCDAAPYFRVFNPVLQAQRFDPNQTYIRRWLPEYGTTKYPEPIVEHRAARARALAAFQSVQ